MYCFLLTFNTMFSGNVLFKASHGNCFFEIEESHTFLIYQSWQWRNNNLDMRQKWKKTSHICLHNCQMEGQTERNNHSWCIWYPWHQIIVYQLYFGIFVNVQNEQSISCYRGLNWIAEYLICFYQFTFRETFVMWYMFLLGCCICCCLMYVLFSVPFWFLIYIS